MNDNKNTEIMKKEIYQYSDYRLIKFYNENDKLVKVLRKFDNQEYFTDISSYFGI